MKKLSPISRIKLLEQACNDKSLSDAQVNMMARVILTAPQVNLSELIAQAKEKACMPFSA